MKRHKPKGLFLVFEGGEGSGKSTQTRFLSEWLNGARIPNLLTREPGGTELGARIRSLLLEKGHDPVSARAELLLYCADRAHHVATRVLPALEKGQVVLCDRFQDSSTVYQGICRGLGEKEAQALNRFATGGLRPDLTFVLDIDPQIGLKRASQRTGGSLDRMESEKLAFHKKVRSGFLKLARQNPSGYVVIQANEAPEVLADKIWKQVQKLLKRRGIWKN